MKYYLYNAKANNGIKPNTPESIELIDAVDMDYRAFFDRLAPEDEVVLVGGDGTLNYFINAMKGCEIRHNVYLYGSGTGNDFLTDIGHKAGDEVLINQYLVNLPTVRVNGIESLFINNMGFGIDGYCCEAADEIRAKTPNKEINYAGIAIKGLLFTRRSTNATVTVDGKEYKFQHVWLAPTMKGRYYGGGIKMAPDQDRNSDHLTVVVYHSLSRLVSLVNFPKVFEGTHVKKTGMVSVITGNKIHVKFDRPYAAQIDGETVLNVYEYEAEL